MIRVGEAAWLLDLASNAQVRAALNALAATEDAAVYDVVPGASTLLVVTQPGAAFDPDRLRELERTTRSEAAAAASTSPPHVHHVPVRYDGEDLAELARAARLSVDELVARHAAADYRVAFVGFQPGFAYLDGLPPELHAPRRASPRPRVPAGSVAIGGEWTGVYPLATPGGWNLLGTTDLVLFATDVDPPALLQPGDAVRFVPR